MEAWTDPRVRRVVLPWGAQLGKTEILINCMMYCVDVDPANILFVLPDDKVRDKFIATRLRTTWEDNRWTRDYTPERKTALGQKAFSLTNCNIIFAGSNSPAGLASMPIRYLVIDELDKGGHSARGNEGSWLNLARARTVNFWNRKEMNCCTPTIEDVGIWREWLKSDQREWFVPCPHCGEFQTYQFDRLRWEERPRDMTTDDFAEMVADGKVGIWYECAHCGESIEEKHKWQMNQDGEWRPKSGKRGSIAGFHISSLASQFYPWRDLLADFYRSKDDPGAYREFKNQKLGLPWTEPGSRGDHQDVKQRKTPLRRGMLPKWTKRVTCGADYQGDRVVWSIWAWGDGRQAHLVDHGESLNLETFKMDALEREFPTEGQDANIKRVIQVGFIDRNYRSSEVDEFCWQNRHLNIKGCRGAATIKGKYLVSEAEVAPGRVVKYWNLNVDDFKNLLFSIFQAEDGGEYRMTFHDETDIVFASQFVAEERVKEQDSKGFTKIVWKIKGSGSRDNHYWDTGVYALAAAELSGQAKQEMNKRGVGVVKRRRATATRRHVESGLL